MAQHFHPRRVLGRTGFVATQLGIGDVADRAVPIEQCVATVRRAIDAGLNVVDTAPGYEKGYSEEIVGRAVRDRRDGLFIIDKIDFLDQPVTPQVDKSLGLIEIDGVDLFVFHALSDLGLWEKLSMPGGAFDELAECARAGKTRFRGISSHHPVVLREAITSGLCDVVMFPIGAFVDARYVDEILPLARKHNVGTVCFKTFGAGRLLGGAAEDNRQMHLRPRGKLSSGGSNAAVLDAPPGTSGGGLTAEECVHYTLSCDPDVALLGMSFPNERDAAFAAAESFAGPMSAARMAGIRARAAKAIGEKGAGWNP